jgi:DNA integrity scanning protein DisA with diadenylate cyclase activity/predicted RNA-binding Zn-ribbon protein involved in translation (DUF1610 family)
LSVTDRMLRRRERLRAELVDEGITLDLEPDDPRTDLLLEEIVYASHPPVHEQRQNPYGAMIYQDEDPAPSDIRLDDHDYRQYVGSLIHGTNFRPPAATDIDLLRRMSDGRSSFLARSPGGMLSIFEFVTPVNELRLSQVRPAIVVQRSDSGEVKVFSTENIWSLDRGEWAAKPYSTTVAQHLDRTLLANLPARAFGRPKRDVLEQIIRFSLHTLSPQHIGATIVWRPRCEAPWRNSPYIANTGPVPPLNISFRVYPWRPEILSTLLSVIDGACLVGPDGFVDHIKAQLTASERAIQHVPEDGGLRHISARRYSFDDPESVVIVVSHDGPVTVYSDGMAVMRLRATAAPTQNHTREDLEYRLAHRDLVRCAVCGREIAIGSAPQPGPRVAFPCPVCGGQDLLSAPDNVCAWPVKPWSI